MDIYLAIVLEAEPAVDVIALTRGGQDADSDSSVILVLLVH
jgi:hypothetical protein